MFQGYVKEYPQTMWPYMVQCFHFGVLKFPLTIALYVAMMWESVAMDNRHIVDIENPEGWNTGVVTNITKEYKT